MFRYGLEEIPECLIKRNIYLYSSRYYFYLMWNEVLEKVKTKSM